MLTTSQISRRVLARHGIEPPKAKPAPYPIDWIENNFYLYDTGKLMNLYDCQRRPLELALSRDADGNFRYNTILWSWPKKSAKSSVIAAVADYTANSRPNGSVKLVANDLKQADSRVGYYIREAIRLGQKNGKRQGIKMTPSGFKISYLNGAKVECVPIDPTGEAGGNDDMIVYSELWGWKSKAHQRMWSEMTLSPTKWGNAQRWIDTYAGIVGESPILEQLYETGVKNGVRVWDDLEVYVNEAAKMLTVWVTKPMFPWQTPDYYTQEAGQLLPSEFNRMHRNEWAESTEAFIPYEWWKSCTRHLERPADKKGIILGIDAAVDSDWFAIVGVSVIDRKFRVVYCRVWKPSQGGKIDLKEPAAEIERLRHEVNIECVAYDPTQMEYMAQTLGDNLFWYKVDQGKHRLIADKYLYDVIKEQQLEHDGSYAELNESVANADRKPEDKYLRIVKRATGLHIDPLVALSMAVERAAYYNL